MKAVVVLSGGMDSATLAYLLKSQGYAVFGLMFDYGQRHKKELGYAERIMQRIGGEYLLVNLAQPGLFGRSSLTDRAIEVPDGHYAEPSMSATVVPNRNPIMLAIAFAVAIGRGAEAVAIGVHAGDHFIYPDCRPAFIDAFSGMERLALEGGPALLAPFIGKSKADIVRIGNDLGVPYADTWSCYKGALRHCGTCGTCVERKEAFALAGVDDPTDYKTRA